MMRDLMSAPPVPLHQENTKPKIDEFVVFELPDGSITGNNRNQKSTTHKYRLYNFKQSREELLIWQKNLLNIFQHLKAQSSKDKYAHAERLIDGNAKTLWLTVKNQIDARGANF